MAIDDQFTFSMDAQLGSHVLGFHVTNLSEVTFAIVYQEANSC